MTEKSPDAFRTISEVSTDLGVPQHVLRFWEVKFPQLKPMKRAGNRRYYRPGDMKLLERIRDLLYREGYTIKGVQKLLRTPGFLPGEDGVEPPLPPLDPRRRAKLESVVRELETLRNELRARG